MNKKQIKVLDHPGTFILIDKDKDEKEAKANWLRLHQLKKPLSEEQKRRERISIREGKVLQRTKYK